MNPCLWAMFPFTVGAIQADILCPLVLTSVRDKPTGTSGHRGAGLEANHQQKTGWKCTRKRPGSTVHFSAACATPPPLRLRPSPSSALSPSGPAPLVSILLHLRLWEAVPKPAEQMQGFEDS